MVLARHPSGIRWLRTSGDRVLAFNDTPVVDQSQLRFMLAGIEWGERVDFSVQRGEDEFSIAVLLAPEPREGGS
jgi:S1-C subfamily serine protease